MIFCAIIAFVLLCTLGTSSEICGSSSRIVTVTGFGSVTTKPDTALLRYTVTDTQISATAALDNVASTSNSLLRNLQSKHNVNAEDDVASTSFVVQPVYEWLDNRSLLTGYSVSASYAVTVTNLDGVSKIVDGVVRQGAEFIRVDGIEFSMRKMSQYESEARNLAVVDAITKAKELVEPTGAQLGPLETISSFSSQSGIVPSLSNEYAMMKSAAYGSTPIASGTSTVTQSVQATFRIC